MGLAPSGDIGDRHALFQPAHGSAPTIAGKGIANPLAMILSGKMMLEWLGMRHHDEYALQAAKKVEDAVIAVLEKHHILPQDLGGDARTSEIGDAIAEEIVR
jgi:3-isopropylmalate dehydrogenase